MSSNSDAFNDTTFNSDQFNVSDGYIEDKLYVTTINPYSGTTNYFNNSVTIAQNLIAHGDEIFIGNETISGNLTVTGALILGHFWVPLALLVQPLVIP